MKERKHINFLEAGNTSTLLRAIYLYTNDMYNGKNVCSVDRDRIKKSSEKHTHFSSVFFASRPIVGLNSQELSQNCCRCRRSGWWMCLFLVLLPTCRFRNRFVCILFLFAPAYHMTSIERLDILIDGPIKRADEPVTTAECIGMQSNSNLLSI